MIHPNGVYIPIRTIIHPKHIKNANMNIGYGHIDFRFRRDGDNRVTVVVGAQVILTAAPEIQITLIGQGIGDQHLCMHTFNLLIALQIREIHPHRL